MSAIGGKKSLTSAEYFELVERNVITRDDRVELLEGEVIDKMTIHPPHATGSRRFVRWCIRALGDRVVVSPECPLIATDNSVPEPDVTLLRGPDNLYVARHPGPEDVLLVAEVSDNSLALDRGRKARIYAAAGLADYWIFNVRDRVLEVHRGPGPQGYRSVAIFHPGDRVAPLAFPDVELAVEEIMGTAPDMSGARAAR